MSVGALAKRYARAILELATEQHQVDKVRTDLSDFAAMWANSPELRELFSNPKFGADARKAALSDLTARAAISPLAKNSILYLADKGRLHALADIVRSYTDLAEKQAGAVRATVTSAAPLTEAYYAQLQRTLEQATGKKVSIERKTDASLIAGVVTRVGDQIFDGSIRARLADLKETLKSA
ncbi:MAG: ATP synthase F1 subunit delta [Myxococcales bacterium]